VTTPTPTPGQASYEARQAAKGRRMGANDDWTDSQIIAVIALGWDELPAGMQADEEAGAKAAMDAAVQGLLQLAGTTMAEVTAAVTNATTSQNEGEPS